MLTLLLVALQCLPLRFLRDRRPVCLDQYVNLTLVSLPDDDALLTHGAIAAVSLRIQTTEANKSEFPKVSPERYLTPTYVSRR